MRPRLLRLGLREAPFGDRPPLPLGGDEATTELETEIEAAYTCWQEFQDDEGQVLVGPRKELEDEDLSSKNASQYE